MPSRVLLVALVLVALVAVPAVALSGAPAPSAAAKKRCAAGQAAFVVDGRRGTIKRGSGARSRCFSVRTRGKTLDAVLQRQGRARLPRARTFRVLKNPRTFVRVRAYAARGLANLRARARASAREVTTDSGRIADVGLPSGAEANGSRRVERADPATEAGRYEEAEATAELAGKRGLRVTKRSGEGGFAPRCPDADGHVRGEARYVYGEETSAVVDGKRASFSVDMKFDTTFIGRVNDDARAFSMDVVVTGAIEFRSSVTNARTGRLVSRTPTHVLRVVAERRSIDPRNTNPPQDDSRFFDNRTWNARGPKGSTVLTDPAQTGDTISAIAFAEVHGVSGAAKALLRAEQYWYGEGDEITTHSDGAAFDRDGRPVGTCVKLAFDPEPLDIAPAQTKPVAIRVHARDGAEVAFAKLKLQPSTGPVSPATGEARAGVPLVAQYTDPATNKLDGVHASFNAEATSKRGRARTSHTARHAPAPAAADFLFEVTSRGTGTYTRQEANVGTPPSTGDRTCDFAWTTVYGAQHRIPVPEGETRAPVRSTFFSPTGTVTGSCATDYVNPEPDPDPPRTGTCTGPITSSVRDDGTTLTLARSGSGFTSTLSAFDAFEVSQTSCGGGGSYSPGPWTDASEAMRQTMTLPPELLASSEFTRTETRTVDLGSCMGPGRSSCQHQVTWTATTTWRKTCANGKGRASASTSDPREYSTSCSQTLASGG